MDVMFTDRGFEYIYYDDAGNYVKQSSAIGDYDNAYDNPGSSYLWVNDEQWDREGVSEMIENGLDNYELPEELVPHLESWLNTGSMQLE